MSTKPITIMQYSGNKEALVRLIEELQDYLIAMDPMKRLRRLPQYGEIYIDDLLKTIESSQGKIYIAEQDGKEIGMVAGVIEDLSKDEEYGCIPSKPARVLELIVQEDFRGRGVGAMLMEQLEAYFKEQGCDVVRVEVFAPNTGTYQFYQKAGYQERVVDMIKKL